MKAIKLMFYPDLIVDNTVELEKGTRVVTVRADDGASDEICIRPIEAERIARALLLEAGKVRRRGRR